MNRYLIIPDIDKIDEYLELAKKHNLGFEFNDFFSPTMLSDDEACSERINLYKKFDLPDLLTSHGDFFDVYVFSNDDEIAEISKKRIYQSMEVAKSIGAGKVVFHTNINSAIAKDVYFERWVESNESCFRDVCSDYPEITVLMENMFDYDSRALYELSKKMEDVENFGICLDYAHAFLSKEKPGEWVLKLKKYIKHVHINDNDGEFDLHLAVGSGKIDWDEFKKYRDEYFPDATILIEVNGIEKIKDSIKYLGIE
ncbi:MAG: sugar phosphate isomerase/epimerase [Lachnospiraceae bacterium]|nr:sugar phosphate isomerase/epimerase [Lachnospiraceae bacterium]